MKRPSQEVAKMVDEVKELFKNRLNEIYQQIGNIQPKYETQGIIFPRETQRSIDSRNSKYNAIELSIWTAEDEKKIHDISMKVWGEVHNMENYLFGKNQDNQSVTEDK